MNVVPSPTLLCTSISPPDCLVKPNTCERPRPVPFPISLVVKEGSKIWTKASTAMPSPVSAIDMATKYPEAAV